MCILFFDWQGLKDYVDGEQFGTFDMPFKRHTCPFRVYLDGFQHFVVIVHVQSLAGAGKPETSNHGCCHSL
ncbi:hypothetical protein [Synechococcus sp. M16CYN]|uniref:hypothetical protein n=1 Tax=Synechococcus sp. M16CYN TaxID=3103139 RepID=UPI0033410BE8